MTCQYCWLIHRVHCSHRTEFVSFGDIRQTAVAYGKRSSARGSRGSQAEVVRGG